MVEYCLFNTDSGGILLTGTSDILIEVQLLISSKISTQICKIDKILSHCIFRYRVVNEHANRAYFVDRNPFLTKETFLPIEKIDETLVDMEVGEYIDYVAYTVTRFAFYISGKHIRTTTNEYYESIKNEVKSIYSDDSLVMQFLTNEEQARQQFMKRYHYENTLAKIRRACIMSDTLIELKEELRRIRNKSGVISWKI